MKICGLIPFYNEAPTIVKVVEGGLKYLDNVVAVDDGSTDGGGRKAERTGAEVLYCEANMGKAEAVRRGLDVILARDFTHVLFMDGDGQHPHRFIPAFIKAAGDADFVLGCRMEKSSRIPRSRYYTNRIGSMILSKMIGRKIRDGQSGFRLIDTGVLKELNLTGNGFEIETEILIKACSAGCRLKEIPVDPVYGGKSHYRWFRDTWNICFAALRFKKEGV